MHILIPLILIAIVNGKYPIPYPRIKTSSVEPVCAMPKVHCEDIIPPGSLFTVWAQMKALIHKRMCFFFMQ